MARIKHCKKRPWAFMESSPSILESDDHDSYQHPYETNDQAPLDADDDLLTRSPSTTVSQGNAAHSHRDLSESHMRTRSDEKAVHRIGLLGIDFGTETTGVAYANAKSDGPAVKPPDVRCVTGWRNAPRSDWEVYRSTPYVPSESTYPSTSQQMVRPERLRVKLDMDKLKLGAMQSNPIPSTGKISIQEERFLYGWESRAEKRTTYRNALPNAISLLKLRLLPDQETRALTTDLEAVIRHLKDIGTLPDVEDEADEQFVNQQMLQDYLLPVFQQTKAQLQGEHWYKEDMPFYITMTWPPMCSEESREVLERACRNVESVVQISHQPSFEFAAEPEAAKDFVLDSMRNDVSLGESFVVLDCGGGTIDAHTFTNHRHAHRSSGIRRAGKCCGARFVKEAARRMLVQELERRNWQNIGNALETLGSSIEEEIGAAVDHFEVNLQTCFSGAEDWRPRILGILPKRPIVFNANDVSTCFLHSLDGAAEVMHDQLEQARHAGLYMRKVILTGGFSQSPALRTRLQKELRRRKMDFGESIELVSLDTQHMNSSENAVACGAVLRASNAHVRRQFEKIYRTDTDQEPRERIARYSYGVLRREVYQPGRYIGHRKFPKQCLKNFKNAVNGRIELQTIQWLKQKGEDMKPGVFAEIKCAHEFDTSSKFVCEEKFYVSDKTMTSHFDEDSTENRAARSVLNGLEVDLSFLKDQGVLQLEDQDRPRPVYVVQYLLRILYNGDKLDFQIFPQVNGTKVPMPDALQNTLVDFGLAAHFYEREIHPDQEFRPEQEFHPERDIHPEREIQSEPHIHPESETRADHMGGRNGAALSPGGVANRKRIGPVFPSRTGI
ncbi:uncharacterized protein BDZ99DRAFT_39748 [Mytilinidion resinicola]|uniref:Actin-like ATPase domain-containing protein n=1 Tax=Mytilinidion resinicola TaxID=574789 RepID=A0A6A6YJ10_9PEZI|nr:uncharacterized protein BDZ99DRAFT_39748 [Mytilinidion resinicola]KAF2808780.1 hypothetical protein BDZ99DRAFT_39748 [Mytilinidion resinicola]